VATDVEAKSFDCESMLAASAHLLNAARFRDIEQRTPPSPYPVDPAAALPVEGGMLDVSPTAAWRYNNNNYSSGRNWMTKFR
jgi:hypothetical protein